MFYERPVDPEQILRRLRSKINYYKNRSQEYKNNALVYKWLSIFFRISALLFVVVSVYATYIMKPLDSPAWVSSPEKLALFSIVLAGLAILADQVLTSTSSWARHKYASLLVGDVAENLELKMVTIMLDANESPVDRAIVDKVEEAISSAHKEVQQIEKDELDSWKTGVENAWAALKERVATDNATRRAAFEESLKKEGTNREDAANDLGTLKLSLSGSDRASELKVGVDKEEFDWAPGTASRVFTGIRAGNRVVSLCGKTARKDAAGTTERSFLVEDVALVPAGGVAELAMSVPEKLD